MKKILIAIKNMNLGGVEKSLLSLLETIDSQKYEVDLLLLEDYGALKEMLPEWVSVQFCSGYEEIKEAVNQPPIKVIKNYLQEKAIGRAISLGVAYVFAKILDDYSIYYKTVFKKVPKLNKKYDVAIAYTSIISYLTWFVNYHVKADIKVGWIHFDVSKLKLDEKFILKLHRNMDKIYVVSNEGKEAFVKKFPDLEEKCELRYNIVNKNHVLKMSEEPCEDIKKENCITIMTVGRLTSEKGQDIIPQIAAELKKDGYNFEWYLIGAGNQRKVIEEKINEYGVDEQVILLGAKVNPYTYMKQADIYVQTSIHEGYCITLAEAKAFGMPIISSKFAGACEQLNGIPNCYVVERNVEEMKKRISEVMRGRRN